MGKFQKDLKDTRRSFADKFLIWLDDHTEHMHTTIDLSGDELCKRFNEWQGVEEASRAKKKASCRSSS